MSSDSPNPMRHYTDGSLHQLGSQRSSFALNRSLPRGMKSPPPKTFAFSPTTPFSSSASSNPRFNRGTMGREKGTNNPIARVSSKKYILEGEIPPEAEKSSKMNVFSSGLTLKRVKSLRGVKKFMTRDSSRKSSDASGGADPPSPLKKTETTLPRSMQSMRRNYLQKLNLKVDTKMTPQESSGSSSRNKLVRHSTFHRKVESINNFYKTGSSEQAPQRRLSSFTADCPKILILGPENAGKSQLLKHMQTLDVENGHMPSSHLYTRAYNPTLHPVEMDLNINGQPLIVVDLPGSKDKIVDWRKYLNSNHPGAAFDLVFFVIDVAAYEKEASYRDDMIAFFEGIVMGFSVRNGSCKVVLVLNKTDKLSGKVATVQEEVRNKFEARLEDEFFIETCDALGDLEGTQEMLRYYCDEIKGFQKVNQWRKLL